jgi:hypothetical protein
MEPNVSDISCLGTRNRNKTAKVPNPRELIGTVHLERTRGRRSALSGRVPTGKRPSELKPSGYRGSRGRVIRALQNCDPRNPDRWGTTVSHGGTERSTIVWEPVVNWAEVKLSHRGSENRESGGCVHIDVANPETPMESYMAAVIW